MSLSLSELRPLRGAPLSVLLALRQCDSGQPITWLCTITGYTHKTIEAALALLVSLGYINRSGRYAWEASNTIPSESQSKRIGKISRSDREIFPIPSSSSRLINIKTREATTTTNDRENFPVDEPQKQMINQVNLAALASHGVHEPALSRLAALPHVNPVMIHDHFAHAEKPGQAIHRIEYNWEIQHETREVDYHTKYTTGQYAEFINRE